jgi:CHAD domain-containing protein
VAKAWEVRGMHPRIRFREAAGRVVLTRWREMMSYREGTLLGEDIEELHAMRVSSRRLRAAMDAFEPAFPRSSFRGHLRQVKEITDTLGDARDLDVAIDGYTAVLETADELERPAIEGLIARMRDARAAETVHIAALFQRLAAEEFAGRFEAYVAEHTGVVADRLDPRPPHHA